MFVNIKKNKEEIAVEAARVISNAVLAKPDLVLGLATGSTPLETYKELIRIHKADGLDFSQVVTFNLDEYLGLDQESPDSYYRYMHENLFDHVNLRSENINLFDGGIRSNFHNYCAAYEEKIKKYGGIDLQILGVGKNGHIGFNEPTSSLASRTRVKTLTRDTIAQNKAHFCDVTNIPKCVMTMGVGTILEAKKILLLISGKEKTRSTVAALEGAITSTATVSSLQMHRDVTVILDEPAASFLEYQEYYKDVVKTTMEYTPERLW